jgi:hypothetical protein
MSDKAITMTKRALAMLEADAERYTKAGKQIPVNLSVSLESTRERLRELETDRDEEQCKYEARS